MLLVTGQMSKAVAALDAIRHELAGSDDELDQLLDAAAVAVGVLDVSSHRASPIGSRHCSDAPPARTAGSR